MKESISGKATSSGFFKQGKRVFLLIREIKKPAKTKEQGWPKTPTRILNKFFIRRKFLWRKFSQYPAIYE